MIIDADNIINSSYLSEVNNAFADPKVQVVQTHRVAKNLNTDMAYLDAISEEINNSIFRLGHVNLGMSAALIGSGMAFEYSLFYKAMMSNTSVGGFDRVLEMKLLYHRIFFHYLPDTYVLDEKYRRLRIFINREGVGCLRNTIASVSLFIICFQLSVNGNGIFVISYFSKLRSHGSYC